MSKDMVLSFPSSALLVLPVCLSSFLVLPLWVYTAPRPTSLVRGGFLFLESLDEIASDSVDKIALETMDKITLETVDKISLETLDEIVVGSTDEINVVGGGWSSFYPFNRRTKALLIAASRRCCLERGGESTGQDHGSIPNECLSPGWLLL